MPHYCYFPILKTRPSEVNAYDMLDESVKQEILPIIEMTGELGYTYSKNCKDEKRRGTRRPGDINKKIPKILDFMKERRFILDITDDPTLKYDGLGSTDAGLLNPENGYANWTNFLKQDEVFKKNVIPTIQFNTMHMPDVEEQIRVLNAEFDYLAIRLPAIDSEQSSSKDILPQVINYVTKLVDKNKLFIILDFGSKKDTVNIKTIVENIPLENVKALIPVSSSFPSSVTQYGKKEGVIMIHENEISDCVREVLGTKVFHGDYSSIYPKRYEMGGGGWYPRIDFIERDIKTNKPISYRFFRGDERNTSSHYVPLANYVLNSSAYSPIQELTVDGDMRIKQKAAGGSEGKAPSYWIATRSNIYMTAQYLYLKKQSGSFLYL